MKLDVVIKRGKIFILGSIEGNLKIKKNRIKKISYQKWYPGKIIKSIAEAHKWIGEKDIELGLYAPLPEFFALYKYTLAPQVIIKLKRALNADNIWVNCAGRWDLFSK